MGFDSYPRLAEFISGTDNIFLNVKAPFYFILTTAPNRAQATGETGGGLVGWWAGGPVGWWAGGPWSLHISAEQKAFLAQ